MKNLTYKELLGQVDSYNNYITNKFFKMEKAKKNRFSKDRDIVTDNETGLMWLDTKVSGVTNFLGITIDYSDPSFRKAQKFIKHINKINFGGYSDWRLATAKELYTIINFLNHKPIYYEDKSSWKIFDIFKNITNDEYWTNTKISYFGSTHDKMLKVRFVTGMAYNLYTGACYAILPVRGTMKYATIETDEDKGIIIDKNLNIMWCNQYENYFDDYPEQFYSYEKALRKIEDINKRNYLGYSNWRLPAIEEILQLLINTQDIKVRECTSTMYLTNTFSNFMSSNSTIEKMSYRVSFKEVGEVECLIELDNYGSIGGFIKLVRDIV